MPLLINSRHLEAKNLSLQGELASGELEWDIRDELIRFEQPLRYDLEAQQVEHAILVRGTLRLVVECNCSRCLQPFEKEVVVDPWACHIPLEGEGKARLKGDSVDLTPYFREDIFLALPQHPLCSEGCEGLPNPLTAQGDLGGSEKSSSAGSVWSELDKLNL